MCGIFCVFGSNCDINAASLILNGLQSLEYRGYDSAGIGIVNENNITVLKSVGEVSVLQDKVSLVQPNGHIGVGHTRWATHGSVSLENTHPHVVKNVAIVHNGIIENKEEIAKFLHANSAGDTNILEESDTSCIPRLIVWFMEQKGMSFEEAFFVTCTMAIKGSSAIVGLYSGNGSGGEPIIGAFKNNAPLAVGKYTDGSVFVTSDIGITVGEARDQRDMSDAECIFCYKDSSVITNIPNFTQGRINNLTGCAVERTTDGELLISEGNAFTKVNIKSFVDAEFTKVKRSNVSSLITKGKYKHFTRKEIGEQPQLIKETAEIFIDQHNLSFIESAFPKIDNLASIKFFCFVGCGSSYNVCLSVANALSAWSSACGEAYVASELSELHLKKYDKTNTLFIFISQSGETMDTIIALKKIKDFGFEAMSILNKKNSTMEKLSRHCMFCKSTQEIGVAATKSFTAQLITGLLFVIFVSTQQKTDSPWLTVDKIKDILACGDIVKKFITQNEDHIIGIAHKIAHSSGMFFIGRRESFPTCMEGALKMKEMSYIHSEALFAGELKHGHIALIDKHFTTIAPVLIGKGNAYHKTISNVEEILARNGTVLLIAPESLVESLTFLHKNVLSISMQNGQSEIVEIFVATVVLQLLAYHVADKLELPIDKPRNLAKSVTVE